MMGFGGGSCGGGRIMRHAGGRTISPLPLLLGSANALADRVRRLTTAGSGPGPADWLFLKLKLSAAGMLHDASTLDAYTVRWSNE
jgi:hypothetical protein